MKSKHSPEEIKAAVERYLKGEQIESLRKEFNISRSGLYLWIRKAKQEAAARARAFELGPKGVEQEARIDKDLRLIQLEQQVLMLQGHLARLMTKHNDWPI